MSEQKVLEWAMGIEVLKREESPVKQIPVSQIHVSE